MDGLSLFGRKISVEHSKDAKALEESGKGRGLPPPPRRDDGGIGGGGFRGSASSAEPSKNLFVANIPEAVGESDVHSLFSQFGEVAMVKFLPQKGDAKSGFVDFVHVDVARRAHEADNLLCGSKLRTDYNRRTPHASTATPSPTFAGPRSSFADDDPPAPPVVRARRASRTIPGSKPFPTI